MCDDRSDEAEDERVRYLAEQISQLWGKLDDIESRLVRMEIAIGEVSTNAKN